MSKTEIDRVFKFTVNGKEETFKMREISVQDQREAQKVYNQVFNDAINSDALLRDELESVLKKKNIWNDEKQAELTSLQQQILDKEKKLTEGGFFIKEAKNIALSIKKLRDSITTLISARTSQDSNTAEGQADNARFNCLVSRTLVYNDTGKPYFSNYEEMLNKMSEDITIKASQKLAAIQFNLDEHFDDNLIENKFLKEYGFVDKDLDFINTDGHKTDKDGRLINKDGYYIDADGNRVNISGDRVNEDGSFAIERKPFLDDDGNEVVPKVKTVTDSFAASEVVEESGVPTG